MSSEEEEDYMSDAFLNKLSDVRPSLVQDRRKKRQIEVEQKQNENIKRQKEERSQKTGYNLNERLQESLQKQIPKENKGFQLLAKMGYKPGQALGKQPMTSTNDNEPLSSCSTNKPLIEPIGISIKLGREGLGREAALRELSEKRRQLHHQRLLKAAGAKETLSVEEFRRRATQKAEERFMKGALRRCQRTCINLDKAENIEVPEMLWFWPETEEQQTEEKEDEEEETREESDNEEEIQYSDAEKMEMLTSYLRTAYLFCFWCGIQYKSSEELSDECPGLSRDDH